MADFDAKQGNVTIRTMKGRGGVIRTRVVPLTPDALKLFKACAKRKTPAAPLFANPEGGEWHRVALSRAIRDAVAKVNAATTKTKLPPGIVGYTLRHAAIAEWLSAGIDGVTVAHLAGTSVAMIEAHYHKFIKAPAMEKLEAVKLL